MSKETIKEVEINVIALTETEIKGCGSIAKSANMARGAQIDRDGCIRQGSDALVKLVGIEPEWSFLKQVQAQTIQIMINEPFNFASDTADTYFSYILKDAIGRHKFIKPTKDTTDGKRMSEDRKFIADKYAHVSIENVLSALQKVSVETDSASIELQKELIKAKAFKMGKTQTETKKAQKGNIDKLRTKLESFLKIDSGKVNKKGNPIFEWSIVNLDFAYRCFDKKEEVKKFLASLDK